MILYFIKYTIWFYENFIFEDWSLYSKIGKIICYPAWILNSVLLWIFYPLFILLYQFTNSTAYKHYKEFGESMSLENQLKNFKNLKEQQKISTRNFLIQKDKKN